MATFPQDMQVSADSLVVAHVGLMAYRPAWELQKRLQAYLIQTRNQEREDQPPHLLLLVEHPPVYTLGKSGDAGNLLVPEALLASRGAELVRIDRGGDITFHGPGQLVGYPIIDLNRVFTDIHRYLRSLEEAVIRTCADYGIAAGRVEGRTGVWVGPDDVGLERKICAMGIRCSRWVTMHGFAFNLNTDLSYFDLMIPCGIPDRGVTSLARELGRSVEEAPVRTRLSMHLADILGLPIARRLEPDEALPFLDNYAPPETEAARSTVRR